MTKKVLYIIATVLMLTWIVGHFILDGGRGFNVFPVFALILFLQAIITTPKTKAIG